MEGSKKQIRIKKLNKYFLLDPPIGQGTFGKVYKCFEDSKFDKFLACKCLSIDFYMSNPIFIQKLKQELKVTKSLNHPNLVNLIDIKRTKHNLYMFLDHINGDNLEDFVERYYKSFNRGPSMNLTKHIAIDIISGLNYLSKNNIIHRDIKLENIMFSLEESVKVDKQITTDTFNELHSDENYKANINIESNSSNTKKKDFNINFNEIKIDNSEFPNNQSKNQSIQKLYDNLKCSIQNTRLFQMNDTEKKYRSKITWSNAQALEEIIINSKCKIIDFGLGKDLTDTNGITSSICGSPITMAPEIWKNKLEGKYKSGYNYKVDIWSTGCIIYQIITNSPPFKGDEVETICNNVMNKGTFYIPLIDKEGNKNDITVELIDLLNGLLQYDCNKRLNWDQVLTHPFLNSPISKQTKFTDLLFLLKEEDNEDNNILKKVQLYNEEADGIMLNIHEYLNLLNINKKKGLSTDMSEDVSLQMKFSMENTIVDYIKTSRNRLDSEEVDKLFDKDFDFLEEIYFTFEDVDDGFILVDKINRKSSYDD